jgi:glutathione S-transferase
MKLIGMLDSPYVRRVAISLQLLELQFTHEPLSVFSDADAFARVNPLLKAPTLVTLNGVVLLESTLILQYAEMVAQPLSLMPGCLMSRAAMLRRTGLALAACDKAVQIVHERLFRRPEMQSAELTERFWFQLRNAFTVLEAETDSDAPDLLGKRIHHDDVAAAVAWTFVSNHFPDFAVPAAFPKLSALSAAAETLPAFARAPFGSGRYEARYTPG